MTASKYTLLPCPFCGGPAVMVGRYAECAAVLCAGSNACAEVDAWNTRAPPSGVVGMVPVPMALLRKLKPIVGGAVASPNNTARPARQKVYEELSAVMDAATKTGRK